MPALQSVNFLEAALLQATVSPGAAGDGTSGGGCSDPGEEDCSWPTYSITDVDGVLHTCTVSMPVDVVAACQPFPFCGNVLWKPQQDCDGWEQGRQPRGADRVLGEPGYTIRRCAVKGYSRAARDFEYAAVPDTAAVLVAVSILYVHVGRRNRRADLTDFISVRYLPEAGTPSKTVGESRAGVGSSPVCQSLAKPRRALFVDTEIAPQKEQPSLKRNTIMNRFIILVRTGGLSSPSVAYEGAGHLQWACY